MQSVGLDARGPLFIERLTSKPKFSSPKDIGRLIIVENDIAYVGGMTDWQQIVISGICVKASNIDFGMDDDQVNASNIFLSQLDNTTDLQTLVNDYESRFKNIKPSTYFNDSSISPSKLNLEPSSGGLTAQDIWVRDLACNFGSKQYVLNIEGCLTTLVNRTGADIKFGGSLVYQGITIPNTCTIVDAFSIFFKSFTNDLTAKVIPCSYYEFDPTGKSHCVKSNLQTAMDNLSNHLQNHTIIDHLDVQHDWGHCGQYLGTYGENLDPNGNCCDGPHLPLKFKTIQADEIEATVGDIELNLGTTTTVQKYLTQLVREIQEIRNNLLTWTDVNGPGHHRTPNIPGSKWVYSVHLMQLSSDGYSNTGNYIGHASGICGPNTLIVYQSGYFAEGFYMRVL